jgi:hypothetical protein
MLGSGTSNQRPYALFKHRADNHTPPTYLLVLSGLLSMFALIGFILFLHTIALLHIYSENIQNIDAGGGFFLVLVHQIKNGDIATMYCIAAISIALKYAISICFDYFNEVEEENDNNPKWFYQYMITEEFIRSRKIQEDALMLLSEYIERQQGGKDFHPK